MEPVSIGTLVGLVDTCVNLFHKLHQSYKKRADLSNKIASTQKNLRDIDETIKKRSATADQDGIRNWIIDLEEIKRKIEDSIDYYNFKVICQSEGTRKFAGIIPLGVDALFGPSKKLLEDIEAIDKLVNDANGRLQLYTPRAAAGETTSGNEGNSYQHPGVADPEGLKTPIEELVQMIRNKDFRIVAISGPSGSGKSVLAEAVYRQVKQDFRYKAWVTASRNPSDLLKGIIDQLGFKQPPLSKDPVTYLREELIRKRNRYIVLIEEIEDRSYWDILEYAFPDAKNSRLIVTTRSEDVAQHCSKNCQPYKMQPLDQNSARNLLVKKAFIGSIECTSNLDEGLTKILETCEYLPVAISNMGVYMKSISTQWNKHKCEKICKDIGSLLVNNKEEAFTGMKHVFDCGYTSLSYSAKSCLLSLITCPNGEENGGIKRKSVIRRWLAERLIVRTENESALDLANGCFTALINHNFIIPVKVSLSAQVKTFRVHRMMLPFIKAVSQNFVTRLDIHQGKKVELQANIIRLYLHNSNTDYAMTREAIDLSGIRLLTVHGQANNALMNFKSTEFLRVLVLENLQNVKDHNLDTFCIPSMLKYLSIRGNKDVSKLPQNIVNLRMLETLDTRDTNIHEIPMDVILLPELLHLFGEFQITGTASKREKIKKKIKDKIAKEGTKRARAMKAVFHGKINIPIENSKLQTLSGFLIDESPDFVKLLPRMPVLSKVRILYRQNNSPSEKAIQDLLDCLKRCLEKEVKDGNSPLYSLSIDFHGCDLNFLDRLKIESSYFLRSLKLHGKLTKLPEFILSLSASLEELCLLETNLGGIVLPKLRGLQNLQFLKITEPPSKFEEHTFELIFERDWFNSLRHLCFDVPNVPNIVIQEHAMQGLESLQLVCNELGGISGILHLKRLKEVILSTNVSGAKANDLLQQVSKHSMKPKLLNDDGSSWQMSFNKGISNSDYNDWRRKLKLGTNL